ncbi:MAG: sialidase family protein [Candidatus Thorarchaeota archaeon]
MGRFTTLCVILILMTLTLAKPQAAFQEVQPTMSRFKISSNHLQSDSEIIGFSTNKLLSTIDSSYAHHVEPTLALSDNDTLFVGWKNSETVIGGGARVSFVKSSDGGLHWTNPFDMPMFNVTILQNQFGLASEPGTITRQSDPWLFWHDETLFYAYLEFAPDLPEFSQITVARSNDGGNTWMPVTASYGKGFADKETMWVHSDGTVYVAYDDIDQQGNVTIQVARSNDNGESFDNIGVVGPTDPGHLAPYITTNSEGHVYVASTWFTKVGGTILLTKSENMGVSFGDQKIINHEFHSAFTSIGGRPSKGTIPVLRFDQNDRLYVLFADTYEPEGHTFDIYLRYSDDYGESWSKRILMNPIEDGDQWQPDMDIDSEGTLHITYYDERDGFYRPYYRTVKFTGKSKNEPLMSEPIAIADTNTSSEFTRPGDYFTIRLDSSDIPHVVWTDGRNDEMDIFYAHGVLPISTTTTSTTTTTILTTTSPTTTSMLTNTTKIPNSGIIELFLGIGVGLTIVCVVVVLVYYRTKL